MKKNVLKKFAGLFLVCAGLISGSGFGQTNAGPNYGLSFSDSTFEGTNCCWTDTFNLGAIDMNYCTYQLAPANIGSPVAPLSISPYLRGEKLGFTIPAGSMINGITITITGHDTLEHVIASRQGKTPVAAKLYFQLMKGGLMQSHAIVSSSLKNLTDSTYIVGGADSLWKNTWTASDINDPGFGYSFYAYGLATFCQLDAISITVNYTTTTGIASVSSLRTGAKITPNPAADMIQVPYSGNYLLSVYDICGKLIFQNNLDGPQAVNVSGLNNGLYLVRVNSESGSSVQRLVISR